MLKIVEDWRNALDKKQIVGAIGSIKGIRLPATQIDSRKTEGVSAIGQSEETARKLSNNEKTTSQTWADAKRMA